MSFSILDVIKKDKKSGSSGHTPNQVHSESPTETIEHAKDDLECPVPGRAEPADGTEGSTTHHRYVAHHAQQGATLEKLPVWEEAAILFAGKQIDAAEIMLLNSVREEDPNESDCCAWHMLFELYRITQNQLKFDQLSETYTNRFTVGAPSWRISGTESSSEASRANRLALPSIIEGDVQQLIDIMLELAGKYNAIQLDCSKLNRIEFTSCAQLLSGLMPVISQPNVAIEFHDVSHLIAGLLNALGFKNFARIVTRDECTQQLVEPDIA